MCLDCGQRPGCGRAPGGTGRGLGGGGRGLVHGAVAGGGCPCDSGFEIAPARSLPAERGHRGCLPLAGRGGLGTQAGERRLLDREGLIAARVKFAVRVLLAENAADLEVPENIIDAIEMTAAALVWANIAIGRQPDIDGAIGLTETLLGVCEARS